MAVAEFAWKLVSADAGSAESWRSGLRLSDIVLERNARWFITIRWVVVAALALGEVLFVFANAPLREIGIVAKGWWPVSIAIILACANVLFSIFLAQPRLKALVQPSANVWIQIIVDLTCLTALVHFCGSIATPAPFLYVLHIVLSCVFFSIKSSFAVTFLAIAFYVSGVGAELVGIVKHHNLFVALTSSLPLADGVASMCWAGALSLIFFAVWYLVSQLSLVIRTRESQLIEAREEIRKAQEEKDRYAVQMTHQLKAPLDAVRSSIALIIGGYSGEVSEEIRDLLTRIDKRARGMSGLVMDVLKLARVKAAAAIPGKSRLFDVAVVLERCVDTLRPVAAARQIALTTAIEHWEAEGVPEQIEMLLENVVSNAIVYSKNGETVTIAASVLHEKNELAVTITDKGIGIEAEYLPHIFDEYFRAPDAVRHNSASSGIGLAIVKEIAQSHGLSIKVESVHGEGTAFTVCFPRSVHATSGRAA
jgi:signal transduction histidine kinase